MHTAYIWSPDLLFVECFFYHSTRCIFMVFLLLAEYMPGGSLYDYLHKNHNMLDLAQLLKFAIDVCKGMEYLHRNDIIHRDLKTANLLMDIDNVRPNDKF